MNILLAQLKGKLRADDEVSKKDEAELKTSIVRALVGQVEIWMDPSYDLWWVLSNPRKRYIDNGLRTALSLKLKRHVKIY